MSARKSALSEHKFPPPLYFAAAPRVLLFSQRGVLEIFRGHAGRLPPVPSVSDEGQPQPGQAFQRGRLSREARA